jgi:hypothetical protein
MNEMTEEEWGSALERTETRGERKKEIGLILQTLLHVGSEKLTQLQNTPARERGEVAKTLLHEIREVRKYSNKSLVEKGNQMGMVVPHITNAWQWSWMRKADMKKTVEEVEAAAAAAPAAQQYADTEPEDEDDTIMVDIGGEMVEMTRAQANQILA